MIKWLTAPFTVPRWAACVGFAIILVDLIQFIVHGW
jgi:hypothetical protein